MTDIERVHQYSSLTDRVQPTEHRQGRREKEREESPPQEPEDMIELHVVEEPPSATQNPQVEPDTGEHIDLSA